MQLAAYKEQLLVMASISSSTLADALGLSFLRCLGFRSRKVSDRQ